MITNLINGKIYTGKHSTENLDDGYMGSGKLLQRAICKHGLENFRREIIQFFDSEEEAYKKERELVTEEFVKDENTYNLKEGGKEFTSSDVINIMSNVDIRNRISDSVRLRWKDEKYRQKVKKGVSRGLRKRWADPIWREKMLKKLSTNRHSHSVGWKHKEETKQKIGLANSKHQKGEGNSQFGTMWITHSELKENKKIKKEDFDQWSEQGWIKGRKINYNG